MKKVLFVMVAVAAVSFASCGNKSAKTEAAAADSTVVENCCADSCAKCCADSCAVPCDSCTAKCDSCAAK